MILVEKKNTKKRRGWKSERVGPVARKSGFCGKSVALKKGEEKRARKNLKCNIQNYKLGGSLFFEVL